MKRVGERGTNNWERMTWDDALTEICTEINRVSDKYGSEAISVSTGGGGNPHFSNVKRFGEAISTPRRVGAWLFAMLSAPYGGFHSGVWRRQAQ